MGRCIGKVELVGRGRLRLVNRHTGELVKVTPWKEQLILASGKVLMCQMLKDTSGYDTGLT